MLIPPGYEPHLAAVTAAPFDDLPRLAMADWLDEHGGGEWAAYIREQVAEYDWGRPATQQVEIGYAGGRPPYIQHRLAAALLPKSHHHRRLFFSRGFPTGAAIANVEDRIPKLTKWPLVFVYVGNPIDQGRVFEACIQIVKASEKTMTWEFRDMESPLAKGSGFGIDFYCRQGSCNFEIFARCRLNIMSFLNGPKTDYIPLREAPATLYAMDNEHFQTLGSLWIAEKEAWRERMRRARQEIDERLRRGQ